MENSGIKLTKPFINATSTNPEDYIIWSKYKHFKITKRISGKVTIPNGSSSASAAISHGLTYEPAFLAYFKYPNQSNWWVVGSDMGTLSDYFDKEYDSDCRPDKEKFNLEAERGVGNTSGDLAIPYVIYMSCETAGMGCSGSGKPPGYITSDNGIKVSQKGIDVRTARLYELIINSNCEHLQYHKTFTGSLSYGPGVDGHDKDVIAHSLPYTPLFMAYAKGVGSYYFPAPWARAPAPIATSAAINSQNVILESVDVYETNGSFNYRVVVFKNRLIG